MWTNTNKSLIPYKITYFYRRNALTPDHVGHKSKSILKYAKKIPLGCLIEIITYKKHELNFIALGKA